MDDIRFNVTYLLQSPQVKITRLIWQAVVDVPPSLQRVVEFLLRVVKLLHHVVDIVQSMQTFYSAL